MALVDQTGKPFARTALTAQQTADIGHLQKKRLTPFSGSFSPARLRAALAAADQGHLIEQHRLFAHMEDADAHLSAEMNKRRLALLTIDWDIVPPRNASAREKKDAAWLKEVLSDAVDPIEDLILALMDGPGHGFSACELGWSRQDGVWLPAFHPRPQEWFLISKEGELRLSNGQADGETLWPFGWVLHTHGKAKTGYFSRLGLYRALLWPFLYKHYAISDLAEYLESYGLPLIIGKFPTGASDEQKRSLLQAVVDLGHDARAIMPAEMAIEVQKVTASGDGGSHLDLVDWCERAQSKLIVGQTMSAEARSSGLGSANADLHREVRHDILSADARQIGATLTRDLCYPLLALNRGLQGMSRCPRFVFDTSEAEDLQMMSLALPALVGVGMQVPLHWAHEKMRIPLPDENEAVLGIARPAMVLPPESRPDPAAAPAGAGANVPADAPPVAAIAAASLAPEPVDDPTPVTALARQLNREAEPAWQAIIEQLAVMSRTAGSLPELRQMILAAYDGLPRDDLVQALAKGLAVSALAGVSDVQDEIT